MKKTILLLLALFVFCGSEAQQIQSARNYVATNIVTNGANQITAVKLNTALNLMLNADSVNYKIIMDSMGKYTLLRDSTTRFVTPYQLSTGLATKQNALGYTAESTSNKTTDANGSSNALYPTQGAVKSYVDAIGANASSQLVDTALAIQGRLNAKQATLASGTNIKTINGTSLLGSGDITISGGGPATDTTYLRADIEARVKYTDTPGILAPYATDAQLIDTAAALRTLANTKQNSLSGTGFVKASGGTISYDNNTYLTSYTETDPLAVKLADSATSYASIKRVVDSSAAIRAAIPTVGDKQNNSDTTTWDATKKNLADSSALLRSLIGTGGSSGTVTSITVGTGLTGGTITTSGSIAADTGRAPAQLATGGGLGKMRDSLLAIIDTKAPISTTVTLDGTQTLTNKTLTSPSIATPLITGLSSGTGNDSVLVADATTGAVKRRSPSVFGSSGGLSGLTTGYIPKASSATTINNSVLYETGSNLYVGTTSAYTFGAARLTVNGNFTITESGNANAVNSGYYAGTDAMYMQSYGSKLTLNPEGNAVAINTYSFANGAALTLAGAAQIGSMTTANINAISSPAAGLQAYDNTTKHQKNYDGAVWRHSPNVYSGAVPPSSTPLEIGDLYIDTSAFKLYFSKGTASSSDWILIP